MERAIVGFHPDARGGWVAELACGHQQHVRHNRQRLGTPLECRLCDQNVPEAGGEAACLAHLLCPDCGAVLDGSPHRAGCASAP